MPIDVTVSCYIDWDDDGFDSGDEVLDVLTAQTAQGILSPDERLAEVGELTLLLDNTDRDYTPDYASGPHYGDLVPRKAVQLQATIDGATRPIWTGFITEIRPESQRFGTRVCEIIAQDRMRDYQDNEDIAIPIQEDAVADALINLIDAATYNSGAASGTLTFDGLLSDGDTVTVGEKVYTLKDTLTPLGYEVVNFSDRFNTQPTPGDHYYIDDTPLNLAAAINGDLSPGDAYYYDDDTPAHPFVVATVNHPSFGWRGTQDGGEDLDGGAIGATTRLGARIMLPLDVTRGVKTAVVLLKKTGSPTGNCTLAIRTEDRGTGFPNVASVIGSATRDVSTLSTSYEWVTFTFATPLAITGPAWAELRYDNSNGSNYISWGTDSTATTQRAAMAYYTYTTEVWASLSNTALIWFPAVVTLAANAQGAWGNSLALATTASNLTVSGAALSGGAQPSAFTSDYETGKQTFEYAGDAWPNGVNAMTALDEVVGSEHGLFVIDRAGNTVFKNTNFWFRARAEQITTTIDNTQAGLDNRTALDDMRNKVLVSFLGRRLQTGVRIGSAPPIRIFKKNVNDAGEPRWAYYQYRPAYTVPWRKTVAIRANDEDTGKPVGIKAIDPPVFDTNYRLNTRSDGSGTYGDERHNNKLTISWAIQGSTVDVTFENSFDVRGGWILDFYLTGTIVTYDEPRVFVATDETSVGAYGVRAYEHDLALPVDEEFARGLANHLLAQRKDPLTVVEAITFEPVTDVTGDLPADLIGYWKLNESSGTDIADSSAQSNDGVASNVTLGADGLGDGNTAATFNGSSSVVNVYSAGLAADFDGAEGMLNLWAKVSGSGVWTDAASRRGARFRADANNRISIFKSPTDNQLIARRVAGGSEIMLYGTSSATDWIMLTLTWSEADDALKFYINGALVDEASSLSAWSGALDSTTTTIGSQSTTPSEVWDGDLAHVALFDAPKTAAEIALIYDRQTRMSAAITGVQNLLDVDLFDLFAVSEYQTAYDGMMMVTGLEYAIDAERLTQAVAHVRALQFQYFVLDHATYSVLDGTNVLGI